MMIHLSGKPPAGRAPRHISSLLSKDGESQQVAIPTTYSRPPTCASVPLPRIDSVIAFAVVAFSSSVEIRGMKFFATVQVPSANDTSFVDDSNHPVVGLPALPKGCE